MTAAFSALEVAAFSGLDEPKVRKEVEHGVFAQPRFETGDLVYFRLLALLGIQIGIEDRRRLHSLVVQALLRDPLPRTVSLSSVTEIKLAEVAVAVREELEGFTAWKKALVTDAAILGGEPVFPNTRTAVRNIGGQLLRGRPESELEEDYPYLTKVDLKYAKLFVKAYPKLGRPREVSPR